MDWPIEEALGEARSARTTHPKISRPTKEIPDVGASSMEEASPGRRRALG